MSHQINDVLDYVRTTPLELTNSPILNILGYAISNTIVPSTVEIDLPKNDVNITCDPNRLEIVFANLITNAIQSMNNIGHIYIRIKDEKDHLIIEIEDTGLGISDDALQKIFEPLFTTKQTGTGLGLVTCKVIVEQHGWTINVKQPPTTFIIKIPKIS
jgi:two-component system sensor histidine kinase HydH